MKKTGLNWWCDRAWLMFGLCLTALMTLSLLLNWNTWSTSLKLLASITALIPVHAVEEWVFPGGFSYQYNTFLYKSDYPDRYPMCRASDMVTVLGTTLMFCCVTLYYMFNDKNIFSGFLMGAMAFSFLEVCFHTYCGIRAFYKFKSKGKTTIYGPGSISAYMGFGVLGTIMFYTIKENPITSSDWIICFVILLVIGSLCIIPEKIFKNKNTPYYFESLGYYDQFF